MGSNDYLLWVESVLGFSSEKRILRDTEKFDLRIFDTPGGLYEELRKKEAEKPGSARLVAGFCWPWSDPLPEGNISATRDPVLKRDKANFESYVKNIYRVLLTRGMKGCYVYFTDKQTEEYLKERMEM